jgi:hypothetical protein
MNDDARTDGAGVMIGVLLFLCLFGGVGAVWFLWNKQQIAIASADRGQRRRRSNGIAAVAVAVIAGRLIRS